MWTFLLSQLLESSLHCYYSSCVFVQTSVWLQSQEVKECSTCDIECLNTRPLNETTLTDPEPLDTLPGSQPSPLVLSLACVSFQEDYCVQSVEDKPAFQQIAYVTNKTYFEAMEDLCETQEVTLSEINEPSESLQESKF